MYDFSKATDTAKFFDDILAELKDYKITGIYCRFSTWFAGKVCTYMQDEPLFIEFDNGYCLVLDYYFIDRLRVVYRKMTDEERSDYDKSEIKDLFNRTTDVYDRNSGKLTKTEKSELEYDDLQSVELKRIKEPYSSFTDGAIKDGIAPTAETFGEITFNMKNGKSFTVCAADAEDDGYSLIWSEYAVIRIKNY